MYLKQNPQNSSTAKVSKHITSGFQYLQYLHLEAQKIIMMYTEENIV